MRQVALLDTGNSVFLRTLRFDEPEVDPLPGDPQTLLSEWKRKLALEITADGRIEPPYPLPVARPATLRQNLGPAPQ